MAALTRAAPPTLTPPGHTSRPAHPPTPFSQPPSPPTPSPAPARQPPISPSSAHTSPHNPQPSASTPLSPSTPPPPPPGPRVRGQGTALVRQPFPLRRAPSASSATPAAVGGQSRSPGSASPKPSSSTAAAGLAGVKRVSGASLNGSAAPRNSTTSPPAASIVNRDLRPTNLGGGAAFGVPAPAGSQQQRGAAVASGAPAGARPSGLARSASSPHESQGAAPAAAPFTRRLPPPAQPPPRDSPQDESPAVWSLPIPQAVDLAAAGRPVGPDSHPGGAAASLPSSGAGPPSLPPSFRRAVAAYDEAVAAGRQALLQEAEGSGPAGAQSPQQHVASCGRSYVSRLEARYGGGKQQQQDVAADGMGEDPQTLLAAIVAAQTWLMQALTELVSPGGISSGVSAAEVQSLLGDVGAAQLRLRLSSACLAPPRQARPAPQPEGQQPPACSGAAADADELKAAERWRNRFLRMLAGGAGHAGTRSSDASGTAPFPTPMLRPVGLWLPDACWAALTQLPSQEPTPSPQAANTRTASRSSPLQRTWQQALPRADTHTRDSADPDTGAEGTGVSPVPGAGAGAGSAAQPLTYAQVLRCGASAASAAAHARSQLQLQWHLCQLAWEGGPASRLVPTHTDCSRLQDSHMLRRHRLNADQDAGTQPGSRSGIRSETRSEASPGLSAGSGFQQRQRQRREGGGVEERDGSLREERWLARCRMAHMLLVKGAWNRHCCVSQPVEDESPEERQ
ncbi:MAG: hypothetical protein WDW36_005468 [Sanguina aurantia]